MELQSTTAQASPNVEVDRIDALMADRVFMNMALGKTSNNGVTFTTETKNARFDDGMLDIVAFLKEIGEE